MQQARPSSNPGSGRVAGLAALAMITAWLLLFAGLAPAHAAGTASISGRVTDKATGQPLANVAVTAYGIGSGSATTDVNGNYTISALDAGSYRIFFNPAQDTNYLGAWWGGPSYEDATLLSLTTGQARTGINNALVPGASIAGTVTRSDTGAPLAGVTVVAEGPSWGYSVTDGAGKYQITRLTAGSFSVRTIAAPTTGELGDLLPASKPVSTSSGATKTADFPLQFGGHISGTVDIQTMGPAPWASVVAYRWDGAAATWTHVMQGTALGSYTLIDKLNGGTGAVPAGTYTVGFEYPGMCTRYWNGKFSLDTANKFSLATHETKTGISAYLTPTCTNPKVTGPKPTISGIPSVGLKLTANAGSWSPAPVALAYQWLADGAKISGATGSTFTPTSAQQGKTITVAVTGSRPGFTSVTNTSAATAKIPLTTAPTITGTRAVGLKIAAERGSWTSGTSFAYQWYADGAPITGATGSSFTLTSAQQGKSVTVKVTGSLAGYATVTRTSAATAKIPLTTSPTIGGTRAVGFTVTAKPGTWTTGTAFGYQWYANGTAITGATGSTFTLTTAQQGKTITVKATGSLSGYGTVTRTSAVTAKIPLTAAPTITGTRTVGSTLTAKPGTWTTGTAFGYQWYANGTAITAATGSTFKLTTAQKGKTITVKVTGTLTGYHTITRTSTATSAIG